MMKQKPSLHRCLKLLCALGSFVIIAACATPRQFEQPLSDTRKNSEQLEQFKLAIQYHNRERFRLADVAFPLMKASVEECGKRTHYSLGMFLHSLSDYPKNQQDTATQLFGFTSEAPQQLKVLHSIAHGPSVNHLFKGDELISVNNSTVTPQTKSLKQQLQAAIGSGKLITLTLMRNGTKISVSVQPILVCDYAIRLSRSAAINGFADGTQIIITSGLMRFATKDNELALIIAHELAHNTLDHIPKRFTNVSLGILVDAFLSIGGIPSPLLGAGIGANLHSEAFETEADLEGLRLMHKAGFSITGLDNFWRKMAALYPQTITHGPVISHPTTVERALRIREKITELTTIDD